MRHVKALGALVGACFLLALPVLAQPGPTGSATPAASAAPKASAAPPASAGPAASAGAPAAGPSAAPAGSAPAPTAGSAAPVGSAGAAAAPPAGPVAMDGPTYSVRLRDLEQRIDELKEQIRRSHTKLSLLSDTILQSGGAGSRATIRFKNELSNAFRLTRALFVLDGAVQYNKNDQAGSLADQPEIPIFNGSITPADHTLQVLLNLQGEGYGVFSYLKAYKFEVRSTHSFTTVDGKGTLLTATLYEKGGVTTAIEQRPAIRFVEQYQTTDQAPGAAPTAPTPAP